MPNVSLRSPSILSNLRREVGEFANVVPGELQAVEGDIRDTLEFLREREEFWQREVQRRLEAVAACERALQRCQSSRRGDKEGRRSCAPEEQALARARARLHEAEANLENVRRWLARVEQAAAQYYRQSERLKSLMSNIAPQARTRLSAHEREARSYLESLRRYQGIDDATAISHLLAGAVASPSISISGTHGVGNRPGEIGSDAAQQDSLLLPSEAESAVLSAHDKQQIGRVIGSLRQINGLAPDVWAKSSSEDKVFVLNQVGAVLAEVFHLPEPPLLIKDIGNPAALGSYGDGYHYDALKNGIEGADYGIRMNAEYEWSSQQLFGSDPSLAVETYAHEFRHSYQHEQVNRIRKPQFAHSVDNPDRALKWLNNFQNYVAPTSDFQAYWNQSVEVDARSFATEIVGNLFG